MVLFANGKYIKLVLADTQKLSSVIGLPSTPWQVCNRPHRVAVLWTCRQVYTEAIDLLYQRDPFCVESPGVFMAFAAMIAPHHFDKIRHLHISLNRRHGDDEPVWGYNYQSESEWNTFWLTIAGISHLRTFNVCIEYRVYDIGDAGDQSMCQPILRPLLALNGLKDFVLVFKIREFVPFRCLYPGETLLCPQINALIKSISNAATEPRIDVRDLEKTRTDISIGE